MAAATEKHMINGNFFKPFLMMPYNGGYRLLAAGLADSALLYSLFIGSTREYPVHVYSRRMDEVGIELAGRHKLLHLRHSDLSCHCHKGIEIPCGAPENEVPRRV